MKEKIPKDFIRKFLKAKGWRWLYTVWCQCCWQFVEAEHPIKWLYGHIKRGHEPSFDCCHCWNRAVGRDTGEVEKWYRWFTYSWNKKIQNWEMVTCYTGCEGFENDDEPHLRRSWNKSVGIQT